MRSLGDHRLARFGTVGRAAMPKTPSGPGAEAPGDVPEELLQRVRTVILDRHGELLEASQDGQRRRDQLRTLVSQIMVADGFGVHRLDREGLADRMVDHLVGYGPLEPLLNDPEVDEIMVNGPAQVYVERRGRIEPTTASFRSEEHLEDVIARIVAPLGRRVDYSLPFVDARLPDGSRVHAIIRPVAVRGPSLTIRKFSRRALTMDDLIENGTLSREMADLLALAVRGRLNILIAGGAGSGKTTTLNALSSFIPDGAERIVTIEDAAELQLNQRHVVGLESRPPNLEGKGEVTVRTLLRNALRMRPDRIVIGECRGGEAFDFLQAMNTGHDGCLSTIHANSCTDALVRLENMVLMAGENLPHAAIREQVRSGLDMVIHQARIADGTRRICEINLARTQSAVFTWEPETGFARHPVALPAHLIAKLRRAGLPVEVWAYAVGGKGAS